MLEDGSVVDFSNNSTGDITTDSDAILWRAVLDLGMVLEEDGRWMVGAAPSRG